MANNKKRNLADNISGEKVVIAQSISIQGDLNLGSDKSENTVYLSSSAVFVTNTRAVLNGVTYPIGNITSVKVGRITPDDTWPLLAVIVGLVILFIGLSIIVAGFRPIGGMNAQPNDWLHGPMIAFVGLILAILGGGHLWGSAYIYVLVVGNAAGDNLAMKSNNEKYVQAIADAINKAIVARG